MTKALSTQYGRNAERVVKMLGDSPKTVWDAMADEYKYSAYIEFGPQELSDTVGKERVVDFEITLALSREFDILDGKDMLISNPRSAIGGMSRRILE